MEDTTMRKRKKKIVIICIILNVLFYLFGCYVYWFDNILFKKIGGWPLTPPPPMEIFMMLYGRYVILFLPQLVGVFTWISFVRNWKVSFWIFTILVYLNILVDIKYSYNIWGALILTFILLMAEKVYRRWGEKKKIFFGTNIAVCLAALNQEIVIWCTFLKNAYKIKANPVFVLTHTMRAGVLNHSFSIYEEFLSRSVVAKIFHITDNVREQILEIIRGLIRFHWQHCPFYYSGYADYIWEKGFENIVPDFYFYIRVFTVTTIIALNMCLGYASIKRKDKINEMTAI